MDGSGALFAGFAAALGAGVAPLVVAYPPGHVLDYQGLAAFARARLPAGQPFVLLGESFSGPVAIALAASNPPGLIGLVLSCTFARNPVPHFSVFQRLFGAVPVPPALGWLASPLLLGLRAAPGQRRALQDAIARVAPGVLRARVCAVREVDYSEQVRAVQVPVLYLQALHDWVVPASAARHLLALQPEMQVVALRGPHMLLQAAPQEAAAAVTDFMALLQPGR